MKMTLPMMKEKIAFLVDSKKYLKEVEILYTKGLAKLMNLE
jgi:hypothetical protein